MPFFGKYFNKCTSLFQKNRSVVSDMYSIFYSSFHRQRRVSLFRVSLFRGSITVETALALPIFLFAMLSVLMFCEAIRLSDNISVLLCQNAKELAMYGYASRYTGDMDMPAGKAGSVAFSESYIRYKVKKGLENKKQETDMINGEEDGIHYFHSKILKDDKIDIVASYEVSLPYSFLGVGKFKAVDRACVRAWTGYDNTRTEHLHEEEEVVFITMDSEVYHRDRGCRHLNVKVKTVPRKEIAKWRNKNGGKYYKCGFCKGGTGRAVYLTEYGDRYHESVTCSKLKRDVYPVPLSEAEGRRPCKTCGTQKGGNIWD